MENINLNKWRDNAYKTACEHGFHDKELSNEHYICLVISELMEAVEADRKGKRADRESFKSSYENEEPHYNADFRFGFEPYVSVNRRTGAFIRKEDMELLEECERRGIIEMSK